MRHRFVVLVVFAALLACEDNDQSPVGPPPPHTHPGAAVTTTPLSGGPWGVGMSSQGIVYVTQAATTTVTRVAVDSDTVAQTYTVGSGPYAASFNAAGTRMYVPTLYDGMVRALNPATGALVDTLGAPPEPVRALLGAGETKLFVTQADGRLQVFDPTTHALDTTLTLGGAPLNDIVLSHSGPHLYVSSVGGTVTEVNTSTNAVTRSYTSGGVPQDLIVSLGDSILYVANENGWVDVWTINTWTRRDSIPLPGAFGLALTPDASQLWVTAPSTGYVTVIDCATRTVKKRIPVLGAPRHIVITADGTTAVVANEQGFVQLIR